MKKIVIAIDGYSSCGKSTLAKGLAAALGYAYIDSGAMYRAVTLYLLQHNIDPADEEAVAVLARTDPNEQESVRLLPELEMQA